MNARLLGRATLGSLLIAAALISLTGCQLIGKQQSAVNNSVVLTDSNVDFGQVAVGSNKPVANKLTNFKTSSVTIVSIAGLDANFQITGITLPLILTPGQEAQFYAQFQPSAVGKVSATVSFGDNSEFLASMTVTGEGVDPGQLALKPSALNYGNVKVGTTHTSNVTLSNSGATDLTITQATLSGASFSMSNLPLPLVLHAGGTSSFSVTFAPTGAGNFTGSISFSTSAAAQTKRAFNRKGAAASADQVMALGLNGVGATAGTLTANPTSQAFGNVQVGASSSTSETLTNTGGSSLTITQASATGSGFSISGLTLPATVAPNQSVTFTTKFNPAANGAVNGNLAIVSDASNSPFNIPMSGTGATAGQVSANPASVSFGNVQIGTTSNKTETLTNNGGTAVAISQANVTGAAYSVSGLTLPATLAPNQSVSFTVAFAPTAAGSANGNLAVVSDAPGSPLNIGLTGNGVTQAQITPSPTSLTFGNVAVGSSKTLTESLTNSGGTSLTISAATATGAGFSLSGVALPLTLNAGQSTTLSVQFTPTAAGAISGNIAITSNGANPNLNIAVSANGVTPGALSANPTSFSFGSVQIGNNASLSETITNTGGSNVTISQANLTGTGFSITGLALPTTLTPNQTLTFSVKFAPAGAGNINGNLAIVSDAVGSPLNIGLAGIGIAPGSLTATPSSINFGNVMIGDSPSLPVTVTNTGGVTVTISAAAATGTGFSFTGPGLPATLPAGQSATFNATFSPTTSGNKTGNLAITSDANNPTLNVPLSGVAVTQGQITPNPASLTFGNVAVGSTKTLTETLTNSGGSSLTISAAAATGTGFTLSGLTLPLTLTAGQSTTFSVQFAATAGAASGNVTITSNGANPTLNIPATATGVTAGTLSANPTSFSFGNVQVGSNTSLPEALTNTGGSNVTISQANVTGAGLSVTGLTLPATLTPNQTVNFNVKFAPTSAGAITGNLAIISDASNSPLNLALAATGVAPGQITPNPTSLVFGNVVVGNTKTLNETLTNSGGSSLTISAATATGAGVGLSGLTLPLTLTAGQSATFSVQFAPTAGGAVTGNVAITSNGSNPNLNIPVTGTGQAPGTLSANPTAQSFGSVQVGNTVSQSQTLTNAGGTAVTISQANVTGTGFSITGLTLPTTLNAGQSVTFTAKFTPTATGAVSGNLAILSDASNSTLNVGLTGTGTAPGQLSVSPTTLSFGNVTVGVGVPLPGSLTATGASVTVTSGSSNSSEFVLSGITLPKTIAAGQSATFTVTFTPNASGATSTSLTFLSNASNSPTVETLTGTGQAPQPHSVDLSWTASQSSGVVGYNIYRGTVSGGPYSKVNSTPNADTTYTDPTVTAGQTYFYVAKAVDTNDAESGPSNEVQAVIPTP